MRILVLGGTAFLSADVVRQAVAAGHKVTCLVRGSAAEPPAGVVWLKADRASGRIAYEGAGGEWDEVVGNHQLRRITASPRLRSR